MASLISDTARPFNFKGLSDEELETLITNTEAQQASMMAFYNKLIDERVGRGLKLPQERFLEDDIPPQF